MAGLFGMMKSKPPPLSSPGDGNIYAMAVDFPSVSERVFDAELNLLLMDGLLGIAIHIYECYCMTSCM